jgi:hypothetical protein
MATSNRPRGSTKSRNPKTTGKNPKEPAPREPRPTRAHRNDTPEARGQRGGMPKTHPTRAASAARKDK